MATCPWFCCLSSGVHSNPSCPSFLSLYFGAQSPRTFASTFHSTDRLGERPIHVACGKVEDSVRQFGTEIDRFYVDGGVFKNADAAGSYGTPSHPSPGLTILVLIPDVRCLAELNRLQRRGVDLPYILLNQFDADLSLHRDIRQLLEKQFQEQLIPVAISHDPAISAALAQGTTIIDYSPGASVTADLYKLSEWLDKNVSTGASAAMTSLERLIERSTVGYAL